MILGRLFSWQRLLPRQFLPRPRPSTHYQLGVCVQTAAGLFCQPLLLPAPLPLPSYPMPPNWLFYLRPCLSPR